METIFLCTANKSSALGLLKLRCDNHKVKYGEPKKTLKDFLEQLPISDKNSLLSYEEENRNIYLAESVLFSETTGTTGRSMLTPRSKIDLVWNTKNQANVYKMRLQSGLDRVAIIHPSVLSPFVEATALALNDLNIGYIRLFPIPKICDYDRISEAIKKFQITTIITTPTLAYKTIYELKKITDNLTGTSINKILLTGEYISKANMENFQEIMNNVARVTPFVYGSSEAATLMYGMEDEYYRPILEDFIFEIVDINVGDDDYFGNCEAIGKLVVTWLRKGMIPIVRYDTKDIFIVKSDKRTGEFLFRHIGRNVESNFSLHEQVSIDQAIYKLPIGIYDYNVRKNGHGLVISLVADQVTQEKDVVNSLAYVLGLAKEQITLNINDKNNRFYEFSPTPKQNRFL